MKIKRLLVSLGIALVILSPVAVSATVAAPTTFNIASLEAYQNILETGDQLYLVSGNIDYTVNPTGYLVSDLYLVRLMNGVTELGNTTPYAFYDSGFAYFVSGLYFSAADVTALGMGFGVGTGYSVNVEGNPLISWTAARPSISSSTFSQWRVGTSLADSVSALTIRLRVLATNCENNWNPVTLNIVDSVSGVTKLSVYGEEYFVNAVPNCKIMCPDLFVASITPVQLVDSNIATDYYTVGDDNNSLIYDTHWTAQTFKASSTYNIAGVYFKGYKIGVPGTITASIKATLAGVPNGADLGSGTFDATVITANIKGDWYQIAFTADIALTMNTTYAIVLKMAAGDINNALSWRVDTAGTYSNGSLYASVNSGGAWNNTAASDLMFITTGGIGTQNLSFARQLEGNLYGTPLEAPIRGLATAMGVDFILIAALVWYIFSIVAAVLVVRIGMSFKIALPIIALLSPIGAYLGFIPLEAAITVGVILGLGGLYLAFHKGTV